MISAWIGVGRKPLWYTCVSGRQKGPDYLKILKELKADCQRNYENATTESEKRLWDPRYLIIQQVITFKGSVFSSNLRDFLRFQLLQGNIEAIKSFLTPKLIIYYQGWGHQSYNQRKYGIPSEMGWRK